jgi:hypothetical protein
MAVPMLVPPGEAISPRNSCRHVAARLLCCSQRTKALYHCQPFKDPVLDRHDIGKPKQLGQNLTLP